MTHDELCTALRYYRTHHEVNDHPLVTDECHYVGSTAQTRKHVEVGIPMVCFGPSGETVAYDLCVSEYWKVTDLLLALSQCTSIPARFIKLKDVIGNRFLGTADYTIWRRSDARTVWHLTIEVTSIPAMPRAHGKQFAATWNEVLLNISNTIAPLNKRLANAKAEREYILDRLAATSQEILIDSGGRTLLHYVLHATTEASLGERKLISSTEQLVKKLASHPDEANVIQISTMHDDLVGSNLAGEEVFRMSLADMPAHITAGDLQARVADLLALGNVSITIFAGEEQLVFSDTVSELNSLSVFIRRRGFTSLVINSQIPRCGDTALMLAVCFSSVEVVKILLETDSVDLGIRTDAGNTALSLAVSGGKRDCVVQLLKARASCLINDPTENNKTVLEIARLKGHLDILSDLMAVSPNFTAEANASR